MNVGLLRNIAHDSVRVRVVTRDEFHAFTAARHERYVRSSSQRLPDERQSKAGRAAGNRHSQAIKNTEWMIRWVMKHSQVLLQFPIPQYKFKLA
jgi:hypothetical protein